MAISDIVRTKLYVPTAGKTAIGRPRLLEMMDGALEVPLTLVSAPAGYGKSVLTSDWVRQTELPTAWLSLDADDAEISRFLQYFIAVLEGASGTPCDGLREIAAASNLPGAAEIAGEIINELDNPGRQRVLVFDDFHNIPASSPVIQLFSELISHPARGVHLVIVSRRDPPLALGRLRASGHILEVRLEDLAFSDSEAGDLIAASTGESLGSEELKSVQRNIEGWAVGLHLLGLALTSSTNRAMVLQALGDGTSDMREYLVSEALRGLTGADLDRVLHASLLDRFCVDLLDGITGSNDSSPAIDYIARFRRAGLFVVELDKSGTWFRFHHLVQVLLQQQLKRRESDDYIRNVYSRACDWCLDNNIVGEAINYAIAAGDSERAVRILAESTNSLITSGRWGNLKSWLAKLPRSAIKADVRILLAELFVSYTEYDLPRITRLLEQASDCSEADRSDGVFKAQLECFVGFNNLMSGKGAAAMEQLNQALDRTEGRVLAVRYLSELLASFASQMEGKLERSRAQTSRWLSDSVDTSALRMANLHQSAVMVSYIEASTKAIDGHLHHARAHTRRANLLQLAPWNDYLDGLYCVQRGDFEPASEFLKAAVSQRGFHHLRGAIDAASLLAVVSERLGASEEADRAADIVWELVAARTPALTNLANSARARLMVMRGAGAADVLRWIGDDEPQLREALLFWMNTPSLTRCRALMCDGRRQNIGEACVRLNEVIATAIEQHNRVHEIEARCLLATALEMSGQRQEAVAQIEEAVDIATPGGFRFAFLDLGEPAIRLLHLVGGERRRFAESVIAVLNRYASGNGGGEPKAQLGYVGDLTGREVDILELLALRLQNKEIARELSISPNTVGYHLKHIYQKLGVSNRRHAISKALEAGIICRN